MAFVFKANAGVATSIVANQATATLVTTTAGAIGDLAVLCYAMDNQAITDGDEFAVTVVTTNDSNVWIKAKEFTNGQAAIQAGATVGLWFCNLVKPIPIGSSIVLTIGNPPARDATALSLCYFTPSANFSGVVEATASLAVDGNASAGSLNATTSNIACLRIRATASESNVTTLWTKTAAFDGLFTQAVTNNGAAAVNQGIRAEYDISTGTGVASLPTGNVNTDHASIYVAFREVPAQILSPSLCSDGDTIHAPYEMSYYFLSGYFADSDVAHAAGIQTSYTVSDDSVFNDTDILFVPDAIRGDIELGAVPVLADDEVFDAIVIPNARQEIGIVEDEDIFYETGVSTIWLILDVFVDADDYTTDTVVTNFNIIRHSVISFDEIILPSIISQLDAFAGKVTDPDQFPGSGALSESEFYLGLHGSDDQFFISTFAVDFSLLPTLIAAGDTFHAAVVTGAGAAQALQPALCVDADTFRTPSLARGAVSLSAPLYADTDHTIPPFIGRRRAQLRSGVGVIKGTVDNTIDLIGDRDKAA